jgi:hypothetical protein
MQKFETLGEAAIDAERAALHAYEVAVNEQSAAEAKKRRSDRDNQDELCDATLDAARAAWIEALERRWALT